MVVQIFATCLHVLWCHIFVTKWGWDVFGLGLAESVTNLILLGSIHVYAHRLPEVRAALFWPDSSVWSGWKDYFALGVPATGLMCAELWAW